MKVNLNLNNNLTKTLFLDRDGVINVKIEKNYVKKWQEFRFIDGSLGALEKLTAFFDLIIIITNQQGVGKGVMSVNDLNVIHENMLKDIHKNGGKIDKIYFSSDLSNLSGNTRKPNITMGLKAKIDFPEIEFLNSIMVGDSDSDIEFGKRLNMKCIKITSDLGEKGIQDYNFSSLNDFSKKIIV